MEKISELEAAKQDLAGTNVSSSYFYPWKKDQNHIPSEFLPCHYFDYIAGTSTGGYERADY